MVRTRVDIRMGANNLSQQQLEDVVVMPGAFDGSKSLNKGNELHSALGSAVMDAISSGGAFVDNVKVQSAKASAAVDKLALLMDSVDVDTLRTLIDNAARVSTAGSQAADLINDLLDNVKRPERWLKYVVPIVVGVGAYLVLKEGNPILVPVMKALCIASAAYFAIPQVGKLIEWLSSLSVLKPQGPLDFFSLHARAKVDEGEELVGWAFDSLIKTVYGVDLSFKKIIHILVTVPKALDGVNRIWGLVTGLWAEIKMRVYATLGWEVQSGDLSVDKLVDSARDLMLQLKTDSLMFTQGLNARIADLIKAHVNMITILGKENRGSLLSYVKSSLDVLTKAQIEAARRTGTGYGRRAEPVCITFWGEPGQGKTILCDEVEKALMKAVLTPVEWEAYLENSKNSVFSVMPGMKHWETVRNATKLVRINELWAEKETPGMESSQSLMFLGLVDTAPYDPLMAFESKGMMSLEPDFVIATTNMNNIGGIKTLGKPEAVRRRFHFLCKVTKGPLPYGDKIDLTNVNITLCDIDEQGAFNTRGREPITVPELVAQVLERRKHHRDLQRSSFVNADVQANFLLGLTKDPEEYRKALAGISQPPLKTQVIGAIERLKLIDHVNSCDDSKTELPMFCDGDVDELSIRTVERLHTTKTYVYKGVVVSFEKMLAYFSHFCKITGISWSFSKFLKIFDDDAFNSCLLLPLGAFEVWVREFGDYLLSQRTTIKTLCHDLGVILADLPSKIYKWASSILPDYLSRVDAIIAGGAMLIGAWLAIGQLRNMFADPTFESQSDEKWMRKQQKAVNRDNKYLFRMSQHDRQDNTPLSTSEYAHQAQMGDRMPEQVKAVANAYKDNQYTLKQDLIEGRMGFALFLKANIVLMPAHFAVLMNQIIDETGGDVLIEFCGTGGTYKVSAKAMLEKGVVSLPREYFITEVDLGRLHRDITAHFANATEINKFVIDIRNHIQVCVELDGVTYSNLPTKFHHTAAMDFGEFGGGMRKINSALQAEGLEFKSGDCGALYVATSGPTAGKIVGLHVGGNKVYRVGLGVFLTKQIVDTWARELTGSSVVKFNEARTVVMQDINAPERVSFSNAHCQFAGNGPVVPYAKTNVNITMAGMEKRLANYDNPLPTNYTMEHINDVTDMIGAKILSNFTRGCRRLTMHHTIFGVPGEVSSIDFSTSAGFPLQGTKLDKKYWLNADGSMNEPVLTEVRALLEGALKDYSAGCYPNFIFKIFGKDEKLPLADVTEKNKVRTINGAPILMILLQKMFFGDFAMQFEQRPLDNCHLIGVNLNSIDGDDMAMRLLKRNPNEDGSFGGDISKFEFNQKADIQNSIFENVVRPTLMNMTAEEVGVARAIWDSSTCTVHRWGDKLYRVEGCRASGEYLTSVGNSLYVLTAIVYSYYKAVHFNKALLRTFWDRVTVFCMGDDNAGTVSPEAKSYFGQFAIKEGMLDLGLKYTSASKDDITEDHIAFKDIVMLQCKPRYDARMGRYVWAQDLMSILEISQWTTKEHRKPNLAVWASNVNETIKKLCVHDREAWDKYIPKIQAMVMGFDVDVPSWDYRVVQAIVFGEDDLRFRFKEDYKPQPAMVFEGQAGKRKPPPLPGMASRYPLGLRANPPYADEMRLLQAFGPNCIHLRATPWGTFGMITDTTKLPSALNSYDVVLHHPTGTVFIPAHEAMPFWMQFFRQASPELGGVLSPYRKPKL